MSAVGTVTYYTEHPDGRNLVDSIELDCGGRVNIPELTPEEKVEESPGDVEVLETQDPSEYLTVHRLSGNNQNTYEFCFRVDGYTATLTTLTRMSDGKDCSLGWIPDEVEEAIHHHHPNMTVEMP